VISRLPLTPGSSSRSITVEGRDGSAGPGLEPDYLTTGPDYLRSMGIPLQAGRDFIVRDERSAPPVAVVSETMARLVWPGASAVGQRIKVGADSSWREVVGVAADVRQHGLDQTPRPTLYLPYAQDPWSKLTVVIRARTAAAALSQPVAAAIHGIDRDLAVSNIRTMDQVVAASLTARRFNLTLIGLFAVSALLLATLGVYGVISYTVAQRTREVGIRLAIGAQPRDVMTMIVKQGAGLALVGVAIGVIAALALTPLLGSLLYAITPTDQMTFAEVGAAVIGVALLASYLPARRAAKSDPVVALRQD
jgi:putative ABC transport system permease protein